MPNVEEIRSLVARMPELDPTPPPQEQKPPEPKPGEAPQPAATESPKPADPPRPKPVPGAAKGKLTGPTWGDAAEGLRRHSRGRQGFSFDGDRSDY